MRKLRILLGVILLVLSCALLIWGFLPAARERHILPLPPSELTLPTPSSFLPGSFDSLFEHDLAQVKLAAGTPG